MLSPSNRTRELRWSEGKIISDVTHTRRLKIITSSYRNGNETKNDMLLIHRSHVHVGCFGTLCARLRSNWEKLFPFLLLSCFFHVVNAPATNNAVVYIATKYNSCPDHFKCVQVRRLYIATIKAPWYTRALPLFIRYDTTLFFSTLCFSFRFIYLL